MAGNYITKLDRLIQEGTISVGGLQHIQVKHDNWCAVYKGKDCNCDPDIESDTFKNMRDTIIWR